MYKYFSSLLVSFDIFFTGMRLQSIGWTDLLILYTRFYSATLPQRAGIARWWQCVLCIVLQELLASPTVTETSLLSPKTALVWHYFIAKHTYEYAHTVDTSEIHSGAMKKRKYANKTVCLSNEYVEVSVFCCTHSSCSLLKQTTTSQTVW